MQKYTVRYDNVAFEPGQETELYRLIREGSKSERIEARNRLMEGYYGLVIEVCGRHPYATHHNMDDVIQYGMIGLLKAAELFDPDRGYKFITYAYRSIRQTITNYLYPLSTTARQTATSPVHDLRS